MSRAGAGTGNGASGDPMTTWVVGLGGLGTAIAHAYHARGDTVIGVSRTAQHHPFSTVSLDTANLAEVDHWVSLQAPALPQRLVVCCGFLHDASTRPEKSLKQVTVENLHKNLNANLLPTLAWAQAITRIASRDTPLILAALSARVGSIGDNRLGGWHSYRMAKCALNMLIKNIAIEWARALPHAHVIGYHPGTVDTPLSKPFQATLRHDLFSAEQAANYCLTCLDALPADASGKVFDWQQQVVVP